MDFKGGVALITGGTRGIGREIALGFARQGVNVALNYMGNRKAAEETLTLLKKFPVKAALFQADVSDHRKVQEMVTGVINDFGKIDFLVNSAGIFTEHSVIDLTEEQWDRTIAVDLKSVFNTSKFVARHMIEKRQGKIINIASFAGKRGSSKHAHYAAAKAGVLAFTRSLAQELAPYGITVNAVDPGRVDTEMLEPFAQTQSARWHSDTPLGRLGSPEDIAHVVIFLASDKANYITGETIEVNGGLLMD